MVSTSAKHYRWLIGIFIIAHFSIIIFLGLSRHWGYMSSINDLGVFDQAVWGVLHEKVLLNTSIFNQPINWLGFHFQPVLFLFVPLYALIPNVIWFTTAQAFALSIGAWPIFLLASRICKSEKLGLLWSVVYLLNPFLLSAAAWDFHPITLAVPFIATGMLAVERKDSRLLIFSCLFVMICKEHLGMIVAGFGFLWWVKNKSWKTGAGLIFLGIAHSVLVLGIIMPAFSPSGEHVMFTEELGHLSRYTWLGNSLKDVFCTLLLHPVSVIKVVMLKMGGAFYLLLLVMFFLGFPLAAPEYILPGLADIMANLLSANSLLRNVFSYHSVSLVPVLTVAAIFGTKRFASLTTRFSSAELAGFVLIASCLFGYLLSPFPLPGARNDWAPVHFLNMPEPIVHTISSVVGEKASVSAQANVGAHFSQRQEIYCYPNKVGDVDTVILRLESPTMNIRVPPGFPISIRKHMPSMLGAHLQMDRTEYIASIERLLLEKEYGILLWEDPWLVFKRGLVSPGPYIQIEQKLDQLQKVWEK
jgi:uncharacterized membrane protein